MVFGARPILEDREKLFFHPVQDLDRYENHFCHPSPIVDNYENYFRHPGPIMDGYEKWGRVIFDVLLGVDNLFGCVFS